MSAAAAGDDGDLPACWRAKVGAQYHILVSEQCLPGVQADLAFEHFANDGAGVVDQLLHETSYRPPMAPSMANAEISQPLLNRCG
jgi:hypothetical protein